MDHIKNENDIIDRLIEEWNKERPELDASAMQVVGRILIAGKLLENSASKALKNYGMHYTDLDVLATIRRSGKPYELSPKQLMKSVLITSGAMTTLLTRLQKLNLIYRKSSIKDGRIKLVGISSKGKDLIDNAIESRFEEANLAIQGLSKKEYQQLANLLKGFLKNLKK